MAVFRPSRALWVQINESRCYWFDFEKVILTKTQIVLFGILRQILHFENSYSAVTTFLNNFAAKN